MKTCHRHLPPKEKSSALNKRRKLNNREDLKLRPRRGKTNLDKELIEEESQRNSRVSKEEDGFHEVLKSSRNQICPNRLKECTTTTCPNKATTNCQFKACTKFSRIQHQGCKPN